MSLRGIGRRIAPVTRFQLVGVGFILLSLVLPDWYLWWWIGVLIVAVGTVYGFVLFWRVRPWRRITIVILACPMCGQPVECEKQNPIQLVVHMKDEHDADVAGIVLFERPSSAQESAAQSAAPRQWTEDDLP